MKRRSLLFLLIGMLPALLAAATTSPTAGMFKGQVVSLEADGGSLPERSAAGGVANPICRPASAMMR